MPSKNEKLVRAILSGKKPASEAIGKPELFDVLNGPRMTGGCLPFLGTSSKIMLNSNFGVLSTVLYMQPWMESGRQACTHAGNCADVCLVKDTGRMNMNIAQMARRRRHASFYSNRARFLLTLDKEIKALAKRATKQGKIAAVRLNGTTDLPWHRMKFTDHLGFQHASLHEANPDVQFYEYTKYPLCLNKVVPSNLHFTFSLSEHPLSNAHARDYLEAGYSAAVVLRMKKHEQPDTFKLGRKRFPVVDGDLHDARFLDPPGSIVALAAKGKAKTDQSGFVREVERSK